MLRFQYTCPVCGTKLEFHKRVTMTKRRCPHCNEPITPEEIDRQIRRRRLIQAGSAAGVVLFVLIVSPFLPKDKASSTRHTDSQTKPIDAPLAKNSRPDQSNAKGNPREDHPKSNKPTTDVLVKDRDDEESTRAARAAAEKERRDREQAEQAKREASEKALAAKLARENEARAALVAAVKSTLDPKVLEEKLRAVADKFPDTIAADDALTQLKLLRARLDAERERAEREKVERERQEKLARVSQQLDSNKTADRVAGLEAARQLTQEDAKPLATRICQLAFDPNVTVSAEALLTLKTAAPALHEPVSAIRTEKTPHKLMFTIQRLIQLGEKAKPATPAVFSVLSRMNPIDRSAGDVAHNALRFLQQVRDTSDMHLNHAKRYCASPVIYTRQEAVKSVAFVSLERKDNRKAHIGFLAAALRDDAAVVRAEAAKGLGGFGRESSSVLPLLKALTLDKDKSVREAATEAIGAIENQN